MPTETEIAWAAGLFEGEGCFSLYRSKQNEKDIRIRASMSLTDFDVIEKFHTIVGVGKRYPLKERQRKNRHLKPAIQWAAHGIDCVTTYEMLKPWLGERRTMRGQEIISAYAETFNARFGSRQCENCQADFTPKNPHRKSAKRRYCSAVCRITASNKRRRDLHATRHQAAIAEAGTHCDSRP